jgi:O-antigen/teichoic acid export membrane protein
MALGLSLCSGFLIHQIFGPAFAEAIAVLRIHAFLLVPCLAGCALQCHLTLEKKLSYLTFNLLVALLLNAGLNFLLIPLHGAQGAAAASLIAASTAYLLVPLITTGTRTLGKDVIRALLWPVPRPSALNRF